MASWHSSSIFRGLFERFGIDTRQSYERSMSDLRKAIEATHSELNALMSRKVEEVWFDELAVGTESTKPGTIIPVDVDWGCCDDPKPRIHHGSGRFFCRSCRQWLDQVRGDLDAQGDATDATPVDQTGDDDAPA